MEQAAIEAYLQTLDLRKAGAREVAQRLRLAHRLGAYSAAGTATAAAGGKNGGPFGSMAARLELLSTLIDLAAGSSQVRYSAQKCGKS